MKAWWESLAARERQAVGLAGGALLFALLWFGFWQPLSQERTRLQRTVAQQQALLDWMEVSAREAKALKARKGPAPAATTGSLLALVDRTVGHSQIKPAVKRIEPQGSEKVRVWLENVPFDKAMSWLVQLQKRQGVRVTMLRAQAGNSPGRADLRLTLARVKPRSSGA